MSQAVVFAIAAHPDDIEFSMAGTLLLLKQAGYDLHYMNVANGSCGTVNLSPDEIIPIRTAEARAAANFIGAAFHPSFVNDIEIFYEKDLLAQIAAVIREVQPRIFLVPSPEEYMEDHAITSRLAVTAAFCRGMRNFPTHPERPPIEGDVTIYHALPYGLRDGMRRRIFPETYVDITSVMEGKRQMLALHRSQKEWLDASQGLDEYLKTMERLSAEVGRMSECYQFAEGWRRHSHLGLSAADDDPLSEGLKEYVRIDEEYRKTLGA